MYRIAILVALSLLTGCGCKHPLIPIVEYKKASDWKLSCPQLENAMAEAEYHVLSAERKIESFEFYTPNPLCVVDTYSTSVKSSEAAKDRFAYLNMIYNQKKCFALEEAKPLSKTTSDDGFVKLPR